MNFLSRFLQRTEWALVLAIFVVLVLTTSIDSDHVYFRDPVPSAKDILRQTVLLTIFALGAAVVIIAGGIDLSTGSVIAFSGTICATTLRLLAPHAVRPDQPIPVWVIAAACGAALYAGFLVGSLHAWLITVIGLPPFVATLATLVGLRSLSRAVVAYVNQRSTQIPIPNENFRALAVDLWIPVVICLVLVAAVWLLMSRTVVGRHLYALGGNEQAARLSGIQTDRLKWLAYCLSAMLSSIAGVLHVALVAGVEPETAGKGYELNAIAAAVVGGCSLQGGIGSIPGTLLGALFLRVVMDGVAKIIKSSADVYEGLIVGGVVVVAVAFTQLRLIRAQGKRFFSGVLGVVMILTLALFVGVLAALFAAEQYPDGNRVGMLAALITVVLLALARFYESRRDQGVGSTPR